LKVPMINNSVSYVLHNIQYETDGERVNLPTKMVVTLSSDEDPSLEGASIISDRTGYLVKSFSFSRVATETNRNSK
jgi:hypothetical protein